MPSTRAIRSCLLFSALALLLAPVPALSQGRLFALLGDSAYELDAAAGRLGRVGATYALPPCGEFGGFGQPVLRGAYLVGEGALDPGLPTARLVVCVLDVGLGTLRTFPMPSGARVIAVDQDRFRVVAIAESVVLVLDSPSGPWRSIDASPVAAAIFPGRYAYAARAARLYLVAKGANNLSGFGPQPEALTITTFDLDAGTLATRASTTAMWPYPVESVATGPDGGRLFVLPGPPGVSPFDALTVSTVSADTGVVLASGSAVGSFNYGTTLAYDDAAARVLAVAQGGSVVFDAATLSELRRLDAPRTRGTPSPGFDSVRLSYVTTYDPSTASLVVFESEWEQWSYYPGRSTRTWLLLYDVATGARIDQADLHAMYGRHFGGVGLLRIPTPATPSGLAATVSGAQVTITWAEAAGATHYVLEAGSGPGLANLVTLNVSGTSFVATGVPCGRYYVRVRASGAGGQSPPSTEVLVAVP